MHCDSPIYAFALTIGSYPFFSNGGRVQSTRQILLHYHVWKLTNRPSKKTEIKSSHVTLQRGPLTKKQNAIWSFALLHLHL
jgi:hypothetical protein